MTDIPHIAYPLRLTATGLEQVEQDSIDDVRQCVHVLLRTPVGARPLAPDVGVEDPTFSEGVDPEQLAAELEGQEDRARITITAAAPDETGEQAVQIAVDLADDDAVDTTGEDAL